MIWEAPETAPKDGTDILIAFDWNVEFGWTYDVVAWCDFVAVSGGWWANGDSMPIHDWDFWSKIESPIQI